MVMMVVVVVIIVAVVVVTNQIAGKVTTNQLSTATMSLITSSEFRKSL